MLLKHLKDLLKTILGSNINHIGVHVNSLVFFQDIADHSCKAILDGNSEGDVQANLFDNRRYQGVISASPKRH